MSTAGHEGQIRVTYEPSGRAVSVLPGTTLLEAASRAGLTIDTPCGGQGTCGKCRVRVTAGAGEPTADDLRFFDTEQLAGGWRLACQALVTQPAVVWVPESSLFASLHQIQTEEKLGSVRDIQPAVRKVYVELSLPTLEDGAPDFCRLTRETGPAKADLSLLRQLPVKLGRQGYKGTAVLTDHQLIDFEAGDTRGECFGVAFDIGTTTLVGSLLDLNTGRELAVSSRMNPQVVFGDDVVTRIKHAGSCLNCLEEMRQIILQGVSEMIEEMCHQAKIGRERIYEVTLAGNTTMEHLLCGIDPSQLGQVPFVPVFGQGLLMSTRELGIPIHHQGTAYIFPVIGGFVGGDTVAGILATQLVSQDGPVLMIDIGTNGEIVLADQGQLWAASTAAGPAFEGARISCGMRGTRGAIEKVVIDGDIQLGVIGGVPPIGLCGSGLIDLAAELLRCGLISAEGQLLSAEELGEQVNPALKDRVAVGENGQPEFHITRDGQGQFHHTLRLTQRDIRELQLACGAIRAGVNILLKKAGFSPAELQSVYIAGGFGSFIRRDNAQRLGLLPHQIDHQRIHYVGNASLSGAKWALLSTEARKHGESLARKTRHVELSTDTEFSMEFADAMVFPTPP